MKKNLICIECPKGCRLTIVQEDDGKVSAVTGNLCPKGDVYARQEIEDPRRVLTTTVPARGLALAMVPVRTSGSIPKTALHDAMRVIREIVVTEPVEVHQVIRKDFMSLKVDLIATRSVGR